MAGLQGLQGTCHGTEASRIKELYVNVYFQVWVQGTFRDGGHLGIILFPPAVHTVIRQQLILRGRFAFESFSAM
jgi:hypothetical protein